jgi:iron uptake system EfeUOB component EfeO/EfeM
VHNGGVDERDFEGTLVLEKLAEIGTVEAFFDAIDADDFEKAKALMKAAALDAPTIALVLKQMRDPDGDH